MKLGLCPTWQSSQFRRTLVDKKGKIRERLEFRKDEPVEVKAKADIAQLQDDIGASLVILNEKDRPDPAATEAFVLEVAVEKIEAAENANRTPALKAHQRRVFERFQLEADAADEAEEVVEEEPQDEPVAEEQPAEEPAE